MSVAPLQFLLVVFAGWVNRRQRDIIAYLQEENRILREQIGDRRLRFTDAQRRRFAVKGRVLGRRVLEQLPGLVTPDTILRWYRELIAKKYDGTAQRNGSRRGTELLSRGSRSWGDPGCAPAAGNPVAIAEEGRKLAYIA